MNNLITEFWKIKRYSVIKAGAAMMFLSVFLSYFYSTASTSVGWDFGYFVHQVIQQNCTSFFPVVIMLTATFIISREITDDTLKSILTIPVTYKKLLIGKFEILFFLSIAFSFINAAFTVIMNLFLQFPGMTAYSIMIATGRIIVANILVYLSVLPLIIINTFLFGNSLIGVAVAFVYGYFGTFEGSLLNWFPIKAAMILIDPYCGVEYDSISYQIFPAVIVLVLIMLCSVAMLNAFTCLGKLPNVKAKRMPKKSERKRDGENK
ncbi:MAG: ABC transporter permease [Lachnospiraceae bacterium]|nr:ABC transporter permease [Lachnospiraceae bacterium]